MMVPTSRLLIVSSLWLLLAAVVVAIPSLRVPWCWMGGVAAAVAVWDGLSMMGRGWLEMERRLPSRFASGEPGEVRLELFNTSSREVTLEIFDGIPQGAQAAALPWTGKVPAMRKVKVIYPVTLGERGESVFGPVHVRRLSRFGLWKRRTLHLAEERVKVYPNYEPVVRFALLAMQQRESPMGIVRRSRAGSSREFHQLRDYRDGDALAHIDWKASSRRQTLISRDFQEQRNQSIVFLLDTGRRMRALDGGMPQFDHVLNAVLLVAHVALRQGDQVAVKSFGGSDRWLPPIKGSHAMPVLLNHLYDYQTTPSPSDFGEAVEQLMIRQRRRSLVILLTNLRGEDGKELVPALQVLRTRHLVLLASLRERSVEDSVSEPVADFASALKYLAADLYLEERKEVLVTLGAHGILTLDTTADSLAVSLANRYLDIKAAGSI